MLKNVLFLLILSIGTIKLSAMEAQQKISDIFQRPAEVSVFIDKVFAPLVDRESEWTWNGQSDYKMAGVDEKKLVKYLVTHACDQKVFYILDIGAGCFQWGNSLIDYINAEAEIPEDRVFHIVSVRGEKHQSEPVQQGKCIHYKLGGIKIEDLDTELVRSHFSENVYFDLIISRWSLRHFVDPLGAFKRAFDRLRPETGFMLIDGFFFIDETFAENQNELNERMTPYTYSGYAALISFFSHQLHNLLLHPAIKCLRMKITEGQARHMDHFVINRVSTTPLELPVRYTKKVFELDRRWQVYSGYATQYRVNVAKPKIIYETPAEEVSDAYASTYVGDETLFELCACNDLFLSKGDDLRFKKMIAC